MNKARYSMLIAAVAAMAFLSCQREELTSPEEDLVPEGYEKVDFLAESENTKTAQDAEGNTIWNTGDAVKLLWASGTAKATLKGEGGSTSGTFSGNVETGTSDVYAVYPYAASSSLSGNTVTVGIASSQNGTFSAGNIAVAKADAEKKLFFKNVNAFLKMQISGSEVTKVTVESVDGSALAGSIPATFSGTTPTLGEISDGVSTVEMTVSGAGIYYMSVLPGVTHTKGLLLKYYKGEIVSGQYLLDKSVTTRVSRTLSFGEFEPDGNYYVTVSGAGNKSGVSWANAMDVAGFKKLIFNSKSYGGTQDNDADVLKYTTLNGATVHMGAGEYVIATANADLPTCGYVADGTGPQFSIRFVGGYAASGSASPDASQYTTTIKGNGESNVGRIFIIEYLSRLTFEGITFSGNNGAGGGAACVRCLHGNTTFTDCTFTGNTNTNSTGAMHIGNGNVTLNGCTFSSNSASAGGAVTVGGTGKAIFNGCTFDGNTSTGAAGAVNITADAKNSISFNECTFDGNSASTYAGALSMASTSATLTMTDCTLTGNHANYGGAVYIGSGAAKVSITGGKFEGNYANGVDNVYSAGGAIYASGSGVECSGVLFKSNYNAVGTNEKSGGIIRVESATGKAVFDNCVFDGNHSYRPSGSANPPCAAIVNNRTIDGPAYYFNACEFMNNATGTYTGVGAKYGMVFGLYNETTLAFNNCSIHDNYGQRNTDPIDWIYVNNTKVKLIFSNSSVIGDPSRRTSATGTVSKKNGNGVFYLGLDASFYFINNILCSPTNGKSLNCATSITIESSYYNKTSPVSGTCDWGTDTGSGHDYYGKSDSFGSWSAPYSWNGTMTGTNSNLLANTSDVNAQIQSADADFFGWLTSIGALGKDIRGYSRGTVSWPGCYQGNAIIPAAAAKVMSFNVLYKDYDNTMLDNGPVATLKPERLWDNRKSGVYAAINTLKPDIIGMQECMGAQKSELLSGLSGYSAYGLSRTSGKENGTSEQNPIFYRTSTVSLLSKGTFWLSATPSSPGTYYSTSTAPRLATWAKVQMRSSGKRFFFVNTHLDNDAEARAYQINVLIERISALNSDNLPVALTGDMNIDELASGAEFDAFRSAGFTSLRTSVSSADRGSSFHAFGYRSSCLDCIWVKNVTANNFVVDRQSWDGIQYISDHYPVYSDIVF